MTYPTCSLRYNMFFLDSYLKQILFCVSQHSDFFFSLGVSGDSTIARQIIDTLTSEFSPTLVIPDFTKVYTDFEIWVIKSSSCLEFVLFMYITCVYGVCGVCFRILLI